MLLLNVLLSRDHDKVAILVSLGNHLRRNRSRESHSLSIGALCCHLGSDVSGGAVGLDRRGQHLS